MSKGYQNFTLARRRLPLGPYPVHQTVMTNPVTEEVQIKQENDNVLLKGLAFHRRKKGGGGGVWRISFPYTLDLCNGETIH